MSDYDFKDLESLLDELTKFAVPAKEPTIFAVGGRGYYENPASDLLAFFLKPNAEHGLGDLFLSTYLECMGVDHRQFDLNHVDITREERTEYQSRIDLQLLGTDWCLLIENKIRHWEANPFSDYELHAKRLGKMTKLYSVLSPTGFIKKEGKKEDWKGVSYPNYCKALREKLAANFFDQSFSKWLLFAREFILLLENELYNPPMTPEQVTFVEKRAGQIADVQKLAARYVLFIRQELKIGLENTVPGFLFNTGVASWPYHWLVVRCTSESWGANEMVFFQPESTGQKFSIRVYLKDLSELRLSGAKSALKHMNGPVIEGQYLFWTSFSGYDSSKEAIAELCKLAQIVSDILKN
jgi:hypothetical protein